ncbi:hypothetical protein P7K49_031010 [Saguinus oedipus]|uniref:Uncharacterized protein n=1 Tax=Saguinus oedipus TaxID=9490 RepID=A0ABQ9U3T6_SAGOE|nr:hypothetical protein P7K49_031010 [Saguinus oedipus]
MWNQGQDSMWSKHLYHTTMDLSELSEEKEKSLLLLSFSDQVLDWIENHGEAFLSKHTGVGKSLHRARALQKRHDDFEEVAQKGHDDFEEVAQKRHDDFEELAQMRETRAVALVFGEACWVDNLWTLKRRLR